MYKFVNVLELPILEYNVMDKSNFEKEQITKLFEKIKDFRVENDYILKANELIDLIQVSLSLLNLFNNDILEQACINNFKKHETRNQYNISGMYKIVKNLK